jgi:hypothetical protein
MKHFHQSISKFLSISALLISTSGFALSEKAIEGKEFYIDANCAKCHGALPDFDFKNHKADSIASIKSWVSACDNNLEIGWFPEEQMSVVHYLNEAHYKFKK